jgi:hypothetical protein
MTIVKQGLQEIQRTLDDLGLRPRAALSQSEAPAEQPTIKNCLIVEQPEDERERFEVSFPSAHLKREDDGYENPFVQSAWEGWQAAKRDALTQAPQDHFRDATKMAAQQERAAVTDAQIDEIANSILTADPVKWWRELARKVISLAQSSEGKKP